MRAEINPRGFPAIEGVSIVRIAPRAENETPLSFAAVAEVPAAPVDWLWEGRLALRKLTLVAGDPGIGKSQMSADIAARVTRGADWPDRGRAPRGSVVMLSAEDSIADTIRPRLEVAGADLRKVHVLQSAADADGTRRTFSIEKDLSALGDKLAALGDVRLVVIDPITSYMGRIDSHRTTDVRAVLEPLADFAERCGVAILAVSHPPKQAQAKAINAVTGSLAFVAAARIVLIAIEEAETERRLLLPVKSNVGPLPPGLGFQVIDAITPGAIKTSRVVWSSDPVTITANQAIHDAAEASRGGHQLREAEQFLRDALAAGPAPVTQIERDAAALGISERTLYRARQRLGVVAAKDSFGGGWRLRLP